MARPVKRLSAVFDMLATMAHRTCSRCVQYYMPGNASCFQAARYSRCCAEPLHGSSAPKTKHAVACVWQASVSNMHVVDVLRKFLTCRVSACPEWSSFVNPTTLSPALWQLAGILLADFLMPERGLPVCMLAFTAAIAHQVTAPAHLH